MTDLTQEQKDFLDQQELIMKKLNPENDHVCTVCQATDCQIINRFKGYCLCNDCIICCLCQNKEKLCKNCQKRKQKK